MDKEANNLEDSQDNKIENNTSDIEPIRDNKSSKKKKKRFNDLPRYIFGLVVGIVIYMFGYISHSELSKEHHQGVIPISTARDSSTLKELKAINDYISKEDVEKYLSSKYVASSYNWLTLLLGVASLVVTLLGWFLWINILETKNHIKELTREKDKITKLREVLASEIKSDRKKLEKNYSKMEKGHTEYFDTQVLSVKSKIDEINQKQKDLESQIKEAQAELIHKIEKEYEENFSKLLSSAGQLNTLIELTKKRSIRQDKTDRSFLENLPYCLKKENYAQLYKDLFLTQLYSNDVEIRHYAAFMCGNYCTSSIDDITELVGASDYFKTIVIDEEMVQIIANTLTIIKSFEKKNIPKP